MPSAEFSKLINLEIDVKGQKGFQPSLTGQQGTAIEKTISPTSLMIAIVKQDNKMVEALIDPGAGVNQKNKDALRPIDLALQYDNPSLIQSLNLNKNLDIKNKDKYGFPPLIQSISNGNFKTANHLISKGTDVKATIGNTKLYPICCYSGINPRRDKR